jgi:hypothetical protein
MSVKSQATPFGTVHVTATGPADKEPQIKARVTRNAKALGLIPVSRRSHVIGDTVSVFTIYRRSA